MVKIKFTQGNWAVNKQAVGIRISSEDQSDGMFQPIAYIETYDFKNEWQANAKLISCAPKMFALLEKILKLYELDYDDTNEALTILGDASGD